MAGTNYTADKAAYNAAINTDITTQTDPNSIPPEVVGAGYTDLADLLEPFINRINNEALLSGATSPPSNSLGQDLDLYYKTGNPIEIWRKNFGTWSLQVSLPLDFTLPEGNLTVRTSIDGFVVTATKGGWVIDNVIYQKSTQTQLNVDPADLNFGRIDNIYANTLGNILYEVGIPSSTPVAPALPVDTILIDQVIVPASSSSDDPYLLFGGGQPASDNLNFANSTGLITGGVLTINADNTKFNVSAGTAVFVDYTSPIPPTPPTAVNFGPLSAVVVTNLTTSPVSYIGINGSGTIVQQITPFTPTQRRSIATLGILIHTNLTVINAINLQGSNVLAPGDQLHDLMEAVGPLNLSGNKYSAASTNLTIQKSAGSIFKFGSNSTDYTSPHTVAQSLTNPTTFRYRTRNGEVSGDVTNIDPGQYDNAGVLTAVGANDWTVQRITVFQTGLTRIQYGQTIYASFAAAQAAISTEAFVVESNIAANGIFRAYLIVKGNATNLSLSAQAVFLEVPKFGGSLGASGTPLNVILNQSTQQVGANFNIDGLGTAGGFVSTNGGESLKIGTSATGLDSSYIGFYAKQVTPLVQSGYIGYNTIGSNHLFINNNLSLGQITLQGLARINFVSSESAVGGLARGVTASGALTATANNDVLVALEISPTFNAGSFTGVSSVAIRSQGILRTVRTTAVNSQYIDLFSDSAASYIRTFSQSNNAKELIIDSTTDLSNTSPSVGSVGIQFSTLGSTKAKLFQNGNFAINNLTDLGYKFDVVGTAPSRIVGTNAAPSTSGNALNGSLSLQATGITNNGLALGIDGTNNIAWIQSRNPSDFSVNREIRINPNGGGVNIGFTSSSVAPTATDIPASMYRMWKNTTSGELRLYGNDGGTLKSVLLT